MPKNLISSLGYSSYREEDLTRRPMDDLAKVMDENSKRALEEASAIDGPYAESN